MPAAVSRPSSRRWPPSCAPRTVNTRESEGTVPVNLALGHVSTDFLIVALVIYSLSVVAFSGNIAFGRPRRAASAATGRQARERAGALASVGAASVGAASVGAPAAAPGGPPSSAAPPAAPS